MPGFCCEQKICMNKLIRTILTDEMLVIEQYEDSEGINFFVGKSPYSPYKATAPSAFACILKFILILDFP